MTLHKGEKLSVIVDMLGTPNQGRLGIRVNFTKKKRFKRFGMLGPVKAREKSSLSSAVLCEDICVSQNLLCLLSLFI